MPIMSNQLEDDFKTCIDRVIESRHEDDKINCCIMDLKSKVLREMATIHNSEYKQCLADVDRVAQKRSCDSFVQK